MLRMINVGYLLFRRHHEEDLEGEGHRRHKHKKSKRNRDDKETEGGEEHAVEAEPPAPGDTA